MTSVAKQRLLPYLRQGKIAPIGCNLARSTYTTSSFLRSSSIGITNPVYNSKTFGQNAFVYCSLEAPIACRTFTFTTRRSYSSPSSAAAEKQQQQQQQQEGSDNVITSTNTANPPAKQRSRLGQLFEKSKALVVFYKNGLKELWANQKAAKALKQKVAEQGYQLSRSEYQLIHRSKKDMVKLVPFGLIFLVLPESIPLFVIFAPGIIPSTCVSESQVLKQRQKLDEARQRMSSNVIQASHQIGRITPEDFLSLRKFFKIAKGYHYDFELPQINKDNLSAYCRFMGLKGWGTKGMLEKRLNKHLEYLLEDDKLIAKEGIESLKMSELQQAVEERGMRSIDVNEEQLRRGLDYWIAVHLNKEQPIPRGLLVFSRMFLLNANYK